MTAKSNTPRFAFVGFGEAGQAIAAGLRESGVNQIAAWDILFPKTEGERLKSAAQVIGARIAGSVSEAVEGADVIVSAVTAASSGEAARSVEPHLSGLPFYLDINSVSPGRKQQTAALLAGKARYVDVAVIAPIHPARHRTPMLLAGADAPALTEILGALDMKLSIAGNKVGDAAAIKMIRSVMIKGMEALTLECFLAAAKAGLLPQVMASLKNNYPGLDWQKVADYNIERMASHGERRAAEMEESAATLRELGLEPLMVEATVTRQREMGAFGKDTKGRGALGQDAAAMLEAFTAAAKQRR